MSRLESLCVAFALAVTACGGTDKPVCNGRDCTGADAALPADSGFDAERPNVDSAEPTTPDAVPAATVDAAPACAEPGAPGNAKGVGKYCTKGGGECQGNGSATMCTVDFDDSAPPFCTMFCLGDGDCGDLATCEGEGFQMGCTPTCVTD